MADDKPACEACEKRERASRRILPFQETKRCPECRGYDQSCWMCICRGGEKFVLEPERGWWLWKKPAVTFTCELEGAPKHFHFQCQRCLHRWTMLTATERGGAAGDG